MKWLLNDGDAMAQIKIITFLVFIFETVTVLILLGIPTSFTSRSIHFSLLIHKFAFAQYFIMSFSIFTVYFICFIIFFFKLFTRSTVIRDFFFSFTLSFILTRTLALSCLHFGSVIFPNRLSLQVDKFIDISTSGYNGFHE